MEKVRCDWAMGSELEKNYHDTEWGRPVHDEQKLFEMLVLEGMQAGLSWRTILNKRKNMAEAFDNFDIKKISHYTESKMIELLENPGIIRNKLKIKALVTNAQKFMEVQQSYGSFDRYIWSFVNFQPVVNHHKLITDVPATTDLAEHISKNLKKQGFKFVGPTIVYAYMQSIGMVEDHLETCFVKKEIAKNE